jgi:carbamoyl-phosphate synthase large subunit
MKRVLMTGAGAPGGPGILKCLNLISDFEVIVADANEYSSGRYLSSNFILIPKADDINFIEIMMGICMKYKISVLFPLVTKELLILSKFKNQFENIGTKVIVSDYESLLIANNKSYLYSHLKSKGIELPDFRIIDSYSLFKDYSEHFLNSYGGYCVKPSFSNGSRGVRIVKKDLNSGDLMFNNKPDQLYIQHSQLDLILKDYPFPEILLSEILPGKEYTIDTVLNNKGVPVIILPRERIKTNGGISVAGKFVKNNNLIDYCERIISTLKLVGPIGLQVKEDKKGNLLLLEINPRIQGTSVSSLGLGINLPKLSIDLILDNSINVPEIEWGLNFIRYYEEVFFRD